VTRSRREERGGGDAEGDGLRRCTQDRAVDLIEEVANQVEEMTDPRDRGGDCGAWDRGGVTAVLG
jgi:hypothetical protein